MDEPQKSQILDSFKIFQAQFDESALRARADLNAGLPLEDLIIGAGQNYKANMTQDELAFALSCCVLSAAKKLRSPARKKTNTVAKRQRPVNIETVEADLGE